MRLTEADRFLVLLRDNPTLLDPAPPACTAEMMIHRSRDEIHTCLRCGRRSEVALTAQTKIGERWLDFCLPDYSWLMTHATPSSYAE